MIIQCESCSRKFVVRDQDIPKEGRMVQCGNCSITWHQMPISTSNKKQKKTAIAKTEIDDSPSIDNIKASDGKTYRFLGVQWAELLPSGKTGLFARKKIAAELDQITGRKTKKTPKKRKIKEVDPSLENITSNKKLPDIYKPREGLGFFSYIFLIIILGFSLVGVMKTFEDDLVNSFPESEYIFLIVNQQLEYLAESVKNMIVIARDLIDSY